MEPFVEQNKIVSPATIDRYFKSGGNREIYLTASEDSFTAIISGLSAKDVTLISLFCVENFEQHKGFTLLYAFEMRGAGNVVILLRHLKGQTATSIARIFPLAVWFEREIRDGFGVDFPDALDKRRLFLHEVYPDDFHPLLKSFKNQPIATQQNIATEKEYKFKEMSGEGVYQIPVGPVHAGIIEPGHFRFSVIGETIFNLEIRMFYKHRGIEKLAEGKTPEQCVPIAEAISGDETVANATAFCMAVEKISETAVPARAWKLRMILLEMERIYSHMGDMAGMVLDTAFPTGASKFFILREEILRQNKTLTGSRFMKGIIRVGGLDRDIPEHTLKEFSNYLEQFSPRCREAIDMVYKVSSVVDRLETTGIIRKELVKPLNITGPAARAAGVPIDTRLDHPYGLYASVTVRTATGSDVMSRFNVKATEIKDSIELCLNLISGIESGEVSAPIQIKDGYALSLVESARGQNLHWVYIRNGIIDRYKVCTASFCNWQAIEHAVQGNIVPDFPLINKSLNLSYAGTDL